MKKLILFTSIFLILLSVFFSSHSKSMENTFDKKISPYNPYMAFSWGECPEQFSTADERNQCSFAKVPLDWEDPSLGEIEVLISKYPAQNHSVKGQLWLLNGGPGDSALSFTDSFELDFAQYTKEYDIYVIEHRGVGWSTNLNCDQSLDIHTCFDDLYKTWGEGLYKFNTTNAAQDLSYAIAKSKAINWYPSYVYGVSYGTLWAQRFSQVAPQGAQALILDSVLPPSGFGLDLWDENANMIFKLVTEHCDTDSLCATKFIYPTEASIRHTVQAFFKGEHCPSVNISKEGLQTLTMIGTQIGWEAILMPFFHRLQRCNNSDIHSLNHAVVALSQLLDIDLSQSSQVTNSHLISSPQSNIAPDIKKPPYSQELFYLIANNEISEIKKTPEERNTFCETAISCSTKSRRELEVQTYQVWGNKYTDQYLYKDMFHYMPTLAMNGLLDPQTPHFHSARLKGAFSNINQRYVEVPYTRHAVLFSSNCSKDIMFSFISDIWSEPNTTCLKDIPSLNFDLDDSTSLLIFNTLDEYGQ
ncbi:alpha/beta hydrolase [Pseudoalteromonas citrea]|uniref:Alpha/beta hydrolase n=1 Tax=Pseudoalteromonas citrea TaxID=43655 RepID=A0A5S3XTK2_9GAMM|nr:alpha/beta hydrolase [Pseudoalteromonas citrea]TMP40482.1 alpha/beta hydrolase [Pseudoalteromonas citrea]TMP61774.1 alpha/beta hydrolase [Pseudoalteromonas citrea]